MKRLKECFQITFLILAGVLCVSFLDELLGVQFHETTSFVYQTAHKVLYMAWGAALSIFILTLRHSRKRS